MLTIAAAAFLLPLAVSTVLTAVIIRIAPRIGLLDHPAQRKVHAKVTPLGGGLAIYGAVALSLCLVMLVSWLESIWPTLAASLPEIVGAHAAGVRSKSSLVALILAAGTIQMLLGLIDDWREKGLSYQLRLLIEIGLVIGLMFQGVRLSLFLEQTWLTGLAMGAITVLWVVGLTNALNFLDNMDGLSGGVAFWASAFFAAISLLLGDLFVGGSFLILMGALLGFLIFNWNPARIFMGDAGSNFLGFWLGIMTVVGTFTNPTVGHITIVAPLCILAVPIYDSAIVICLRIAQGASPFRPDNQHFSHRLVELGFRPKYAVLLIHLVTITTGLSGMLLYYTPANAAPLVLLQVACILGVIALIEVSAFRRSRKAASQKAAHDSLGPDQSMQPSNNQVEPVSLESSKALP